MENMLDMPLVQREAIVVICYEIVFREESRAAARMFQDAHEILRELLRWCNLPIPPVYCGVLVPWLVRRGLPHVLSINVKTPELADSPLRAQTPTKTSRTRVDRRTDSTTDSHQIFRHNPY